MNDPLEIALAAAKPIADNPRQPLEVERLLSESQRRRVTVKDVERFREWADTGQAVDPDEDLADLLEEIRHPLPPAIKPERLNPRKS